MAVGDLKKLLEETRDLLLVDTNWYRTFLDVQPHTYSNSVSNVKAEFIKEVGSALWEAHKDLFTKLIKEYVATLYNRIAKVSRSAYRIEEEPGSGPTKFTIHIYPKVMGTVGGLRKSGNTLVYDSIGSDPFKRIINVEKREALRPLLKEVNDFLGSDYTSSSFFDTGHTGLGVAEKQTYDALSKLKTNVEASEELSEIAKSSGVLARLKLTSKWLGPTKKSYTITVTDESHKGNRSKATSEKAFKANTQKVLEKILSNNKWATQKGSNSIVDAITISLNKAVKSSGGKVKNNKLQDKKSSGTVGTNINYKAAGTTYKTGGFVKKVTSGKIENTFDLSLINLLNSNLPAAVRANMGSPRLNNVSGRFSESVRIVGAETTPQGFPRLVYTYQRSPYDVFDTALGAEPWKNGFRDPKPLIDASIRDVARNLAIGRFYTKRL